MIIGLSHNRTPILCTKPDY